MTRRHVVALASVMAVVVGAAPLIAAHQLCRQLAVRAETARLAFVAERTLMRAGLALTKSVDAMARMKSRSHVPCSDEHVEAMRRATFNDAFVDEIAYFHDGVLQCSSWGLPAGRIARATADFVTAGGVEVVMNVRPEFAGGDVRVAFRDGHYSVLVDPARLIDVIVGRDIQLAIADRAGDVIATQHVSDRALLPRLLAARRTGGDERHIFAVVESADWTTIAVRPRASVVASLDREWMLLLPFAMLASGIGVGATIWLARRRLSPLGELTAAVRGREFFVHYQPIVELRSGRCVGAEALVRWRRADGTVAEPATFVRLAEEHGLLPQITAQVIDTVITELRATLAVEPDLHVSINLSATDVTSDALERLETALAASGLHAGQVWLEVTERGIVDAERARGALTRARRLGHAIAIDDFGTGYSCLQYLESLPLDALKIDKSFVATIGHATARSVVAPHVIEMARALGLFTVAEGIESREQYVYLVEHGVDYGQGWFVSRPLPAAELLAFHRVGFTPPQPHLGLDFHRRRIS